MKRVLTALVGVLLLTGVFFAGVALGKQRYGEPKTVLHVVAGKWKPEATDEEEQRALAAMRPMLAAVPGVKNVWLKADRVQPREYNYAFAIEFEDRAAADAYAQHPAHEEWYKVYQPIRAESRSLQLTNP
jgi:hypothetical protein